MPSGLSIPVGWLEDLTGDYYVPMFVVSGLMLLSAVLMVAISSRTHVANLGPVTHDDNVAPLEA